MIGLFKPHTAKRFRLPNPRLDRLMRHVSAETDRQAALDALQAARVKGDTRAIHAATEALRDATHALMRVELGT